MHVLHEDNLRKREIAVYGTWGNPDQQNKGQVWCWPHSCLYCDRRCQTQPWKASNASWPRSWSGTRASQPVASGHASSKCKDFQLPCERLQPSGRRQVHSCGNTNPTQQYCILTTKYTKCAFDFVKKEILVPEQQQRTKMTIFNLHFIGANNVKIWGTFCLGVRLQQDSNCQTTSKVLQILILIKRRDHIYQTSLHSIVYIKFSEFSHLIETMLQAFW